MRDLRGVWGASRRVGFVVGLGASVGLHAVDVKAGQQCMPSSVVSGADLNPDGDGTLGWASSGLGFAVIKATQGTSYTDGDFAANWAALKAAGVVRGAYHFFDPTVGGVDQANYFLQVLGTLEPGDLPPALDIECPASGDDDCLGNGSSGYEPGATLTQGMNDFLTTVEAATGVKPIVYSYGSWFSDNGVDTTGLEAYPLWLADYSGTSCFTVPSPWTAATFWQYDSSGTVSGVNVDDDYFLGSMSQLTAFTSGTGTGGSPDAGVGGEDAGGGGDDAGTGCTVPGVGDGQCIETSACAAMGFMSTPDYCPGPDDIQCCTPLPGAHSGSSGASESSGNGHHSGGGGGDDGDAGTQGGGGATTGTADTAGASSPGGVSPGGSSGGAMGTGLGGTPGAGGGESSAGVKKEPTDSVSISTSGGCAAARETSNDGAADAGLLACVGFAALGRRRRRSPARGR